MRALHETGLAEEQREETSRLDWKEFEKKKVSVGEQFLSKAGSEFKKLFCNTCDICHHSI